MVNKFVCDKCMVVKNDYGSRDVNTLKPEGWKNKLSKDGEIVLYCDLCSEGVDLYGKAL